MQQLLQTVDLIFDLTIIPNKTFIRGQRVKTLPVDDWKLLDEEIIKELIKPFEIKEEKDYGSRFISYSTSQSIS